MAPRVHPLVAKFRYEHQTAKLASTELIAIWEDWRPIWG